MFRRNQIVSAIALAVIVITNGWHLAPIQGYAWLSMAVEDSKAESFTEALRSAMDGREMCGICQYVVEQEGGSTDGEIGYWNMIPKWMLASPQISKLTLMPSRIWNRLPSESPFLSSVFRESESPPPKGLA